MCVGIAILTMANLQHSCLSSMNAWYIICSYYWAMSHVRGMTTYWMDMMGNHMPTFLLSYLL